MSDEYLTLSREKLEDMIFELRLENSFLRQQLRSISERAGTDPAAFEAARASTDLSSPTLESGNGKGSASNGAARHVDPAQEMGRLRNSTAVAGVGAGDRSHSSYDISLSVMVIEDGVARCVPMSAVLDKTYSRVDLREVDTPALTARSPRPPETDSPPSRLFSCGSSGLRVGDDLSPGTTLEEELLSAEDLRGSGRGSGRLDRGSTGTPFARPTARTAVEADDDEPPPQPPGEPCGPHDDGGAAVSALAQRAGLTHLDFTRSVLLDGRGLSLDSDAIVSNQTMRIFNRQFNRNGGVLSPVSVRASAVYHYLVQNFAVRNGCQHAPDDVESFGRAMISLCKEVQRLLEAEPRHGSMTSPCYVFGDLHGNFRDLFYFMDNLISFQDLRYTPHNFIFLGDYVDRGEFSVEVLAYVFAMKALAPRKVLLLRGNHEDTLVSGDVGGYGRTSFRAQCHSLLGNALGEELWGCASEAFARLPLTATLDGRIFCTHGGIPRYGGGEDMRLAVLQSADFPPILSFFDVPAGESPWRRQCRQAGMDTCWADPAEEEGGLDKWGFGASPRGAGVLLFGSQAVDDFLEHFNFELIFRAHQEKSDGLKLSKSARVFTIFSTSAYVGHQNGAGVVLVADNKIRLIVKSADTCNGEYVYEDANLRVEALKAKDEDGDG